MSYFRSVSRRPARREKASSNQSTQRFIEVLESRTLLSAGPALTSIRVIGPVGSINSVVLSFDEHLDPTTAQDPQAFLFGKPTPQNNTNNGVSIGDILPFLGRPRVKTVKLGKIQWSSAVYDDAAQTVTLTPIKQFNAGPFFRVLRIKGTGAHALKDAAGNALYGGQDGFIRWTKRQGKAVHYIDGDGDRVTLNVRGPGQIYTFLRISGGDPDPSIFVVNAKSKTAITGTVQQGAKGDGVAPIAELAGLGPATTNLLTSSQFIVESTEP